MFPENSALFQVWLDVIDSHKLMDLVNEILSIQWKFPNFVILNCGKKQKKWDIDATPGPVAVFIADIHFVVILVLHSSKIFFFIIDERIRNSKIA